MGVFFFACALAMKYLVLFCLFALAFAQNNDDNEVKYVIDTFQTQTDTMIIVIPSGGVEPGGTPIIQDSFVTGTGIMGSERDVRLTVSSGEGNLVLSTGVSQGQYSAATPNEARGTSLLQLDGVDSTLTLNPSGLFGHPNNDFTSQGAFAFRVLIESDIPGDVVFRVYSGQNATCSVSVPVPGDDRLNEYIVPYSSFTRTGNGCDFSRVGAVEIFIVMIDNIDVIVQDFSTWGPVRRCVCNCPAFTCALYFDLDDDVFTYYRTSQFGVFNPTTDFSTLYTTVDTNSFTTRFFSSGFTTFFSSGFTSFTSLFSSGFTSFSSSSFTLSRGSSSSSSDAGILSASFALASIAVALI